MSVAEPSLVVGISGASGSRYAVRLLEELARIEHPVELVVSPLGARCLKEECGLAPRDLVTRHVRLHPVNDLGAQISTGSFKTCGMVVIPATTGTCGRIAAATSDNLLVRAADVTLKEGRKLIVVVRETPLHLLHLRALIALAEAGAVVLPASPGFYHGPKSLDDVFDFIVSRVLAQFGLESSRPTHYAAGGTPSEDIT